MNWKVGLLGFLILSVWGCEPFFDPQDFVRRDAPVFHAAEITEPPPVGEPAELKVVAWNIKYGAARLPFWFDCWGDRVQMSEAEVEENMAGLYGMLNELDPDVLMVEEIEVNSRRSAYYNMVQGILDNTDLNYGAYHESWDSRYIASEGLGRMNLGMAMFSKYPIDKAENIKQEERTDLDALTHPFYIKRVIGRSELALGEDRRVAAYVVHTEAYDVDGTKQKQIAQIFEEVLESAKELPVLVGGDFNELPPTAVLKEGFEDERTTAVCGGDFEQPPYTPEVLDPFYETLIPAIPLERIGTTLEEQQRYYTHTVLGPDQENEAGEAGAWSRTLDYLFVSEGQWVPGTTDVIQTKGQRLGGESGAGPVIESDAMLLSDHAPVVGTWEVP